jgi:hypothetical protein
MSLERGCFGFLRSVRYIRSTELEHLMSDQESKAIELLIPPLTAHIVRGLDDPPGELKCEISENPNDFGRGEEGDFIITSIPLVKHEKSTFEEKFDLDRKFFAGLYLLHSDNDDGGLWNILETLIGLAFDQGCVYERSQQGREPGMRDDERDTSSFVPS